MEIGQPDHALNELKAGLGLVEIDPQHERQSEHDQAGPQRGPAGIAGDDRIVAAHEHDGDAAGQRQEGQQRKQGETGGVHGVTGTSGRR